MTTQLATAKDIPTHRLTVKLEDGGYRQFYVTEDEAQWFAKNINSVEPNIVFPANLKHIDPNAPSFYPKRGAWLERMSREEVEEQRNRHLEKARRATEEQTEQEIDEEKMRRAEAVRAWIDSHPSDFKDMLIKAKERLVARNGFYRAASADTKPSLEYGEAWRMVDELLSQQSVDGRKQTEVDSR